MSTRLGGRARALLAVNGALVIVLAGMALVAPAGAQPGTPPTPARARGDYTLVSGKTTTGNANAIYILDAINQEMVGVRWDAARKSFVTVGYRNLDADSKAQPGR